MVGSNVMSTRPKPSFLFTNRKLNLFLGGTDSLAIYDIKGKRTPIAILKISLLSSLSGFWRDMIWYLTQTSLICGFNPSDPSANKYLDLNCHNHCHLRHRLLTQYLSSDFQIHYHLCVTVWHQWHHVHAWKTGHQMSWRKHPSKASLTSSPPNTRAASHVCPNHILLYPNHHYCLGNLNIYFIVLET